MQPLARRALAASSRVDAKLGGQAGRDPPPSMDRRGGAGGALRWGWNYLGQKNGLLRLSLLPLARQQFCR
jgi:hypothetical protein